MNLRAAIEHVAIAAEDTDVQVVGVHIGRNSIQVHVRWVDEVDKLADYWFFDQLSCSSTHLLYMREGRHATYGRVNIYTGMANTR